MDPRDDDGWHSQKEQKSVTTQPERAFTTVLAAADFVLIKLLAIVPYRTYLVMSKLPQMKHPQVATGL